MHHPFVSQPLISLTLCLAAAGAAVGGTATTADEDHPLAPVLRLAEKGLDSIGRIRDYECTIIKRERREGKLRPYEFISAKIRHADAGQGTPFSVYLKFEKPTSVAGREVLYLEGRNAGKMLVRRGGRRLAYVTAYVDPTSPMALQENRYPVTDIGFLNLTKRLIEVMQEDMQHDECAVKYFKNAKIGDSVCTRIVVEHPHRRDYFRYHRAIVFIDEQRGLPLAYGSYDWPDKPGDEPRLVEEYIHAQVKLNVGLTDEDFSRENPAYGFLHSEEKVVAQQD
ncbi:MAG: DUF1571 domain-containing protein [Planctomycetales bacterium]|nr:DUF1571 domain-containing protein [Planctomycetales bacterium]